MKNHTLRFNDWLYLACIWISGLSIFVMSLIIPWGIFTRYVLGTGSQWPEPISILLMVVFTFFGAAAGYRANAHISVAMVTDRLPVQARVVVAWMMDVLMRERIDPRGGGASGDRLILRQRLTGHVIY